MKSILFRTEYLFRSLASYPLVLLAISLYVFVGVAHLYSATNSMIVASVCLIFSILVKRKDIFLIIIVSLGIFLALINIDNSKQKNNISSYWGQEVMVVGEVKNFPYETGLQQIVIVAPSYVNIEGEWKPISKGMIRTKIFKFVEIQRGQTISLYGTIEEPPVFEGFDYKEYLKTLDIEAILTNPTELNIVGYSSKSSYYKIIESIRGDIIYRARAYFVEPHAALLLGLLIGTREEFPGEFNEQLSITGTTHIIAVSGYNVTVLTGTVLKLAGILPRRIAIFLAYLFLLVFLLIVGTDNLPALRASIMGFAALTGLLMGRKTVVMSLLALAATLMLMQNMYVYKSLSFQLSFAATLGLVFLADNLDIPLLSGSVKDELAVTMAAILMTFPITFGKFGKLTLWAPLANILVGPLVPIIMFMGIINILLTYINENIAQIASYYVWFFLEIMITIIRAIASFPGADFAVSEEFAQNFTNYYVIVLLLLVFELNYRKYQSCKNQ